jgi:hypothetical protein
VNSWKSLRRWNHGLTLTVPQVNCIQDLSGHHQQFRTFYGELPCFWTFRCPGRTYGGPIPCCSSRPDSSQLVEPCKRSKIQCRGLSGILSLLIGNLCPRNIEPVLYASCRQIRAPADLYLFIPFDNTIRCLGGESKVVWKFACCQDLDVVVCRDGRMCGPAHCFRYFLVTSKRCSNGVGTAS